MTRRIILFGTFLATFFLLGCAARAAGPDFSGEWKLNSAKSDFGKFPAPQSITRKIAQQGAKVSITTIQKSAKGELTTAVAYTTDGKQVTNPGQGGETKGSAEWIGDKLMIESSRAVGGLTLTQKDIWTLSPDGKMLTVDSQVTLPNGQFDIRQVFDKQ